MPDFKGRVAIIDYDLGNLFSVLQACNRAGIDAEITGDPKLVANAEAILLPGVGGFPRAMQTLQRKGLVDVIRERAEAGTPLIGICLGLQLLMNSSTEYGATEGLGLIEGGVTRLPDVPAEDGRKIPIPHIGWNAINPADTGAAWDGTPLAATQPGAEFYFVHSYFVRPRMAEDVLAIANFGDTPYCAAVRRGNVFGFQFHPERSGPTGMIFYQEMKKIIEQVRR